MEETMVTEARETVNLIGSDKVEGTGVYGADGNKIGSIERVMIDKLSVKVSYDVLSFGGFLGSEWGRRGGRSTATPPAALVITRGGYRHDSTRG